MRNGSLDLARLLAAFGVVLFHTHAPGGRIGYAGLAYFLVLVPAFGLAGRGSAAPAAFIRSRAWRLLQPWVIWSAIYALLKIGLSAVTHQPLAGFFDPSMLVIGTWLHLWFLPYAFVASLGLPWLRRLATGLDRPVFLLLIAAILLLMLASFMPALQQWTEPPLAQWSYGLPGLLAGAVLGLAWLRRENAIGASLILLAVVALAWILNWRDEVLQMAVACGAIFACLALPLPAGPFTAFCARHSMGVYLVHPLCFSALVRIVPLNRHGLTMAILVMAASLGLSVFLSMFRRSRILIGNID